MGKIKDFVSSPFFQKNRLKLLVIAGLAGILLILASGLFPEKSSPERAGEIPADASDYQKNIEKRLTELVSSIEGAGKSRVMVTLSGTEEVFFAEEEKSSRSSDEGKTSSQEERQLFASGNGREAVVKKIDHPKVQGVAVVCEGGDDPGVCEAVYRSVATVLGIPTSRVYVAKLQ